MRHQSLGCLLVLAFSLLLSSGLSVKAQRWSNSLHYDNGYLPSVSTYGSAVVEVHEGASGDLWYHTGTMIFPTMTSSPPAQIAWNGSVHYDNGSHPSVSLFNGAVVEVHEGTAGALWYRTGTLLSSGQINWNHSYQYDNGSSPKVSLSYGSSVVEVHEGAPGALWYHTGTLLSNGQINWNHSYQYDSGYSPSVSLFNGALMEVHEEAGGTLWYRTGKILSNGLISWNLTAIVLSGGVLRLESSFQYGTGYNPSISLAGNYFIEVHDSGTQNLFSYLGYWESGETPSWGTALLYDHGSYAAVGMSDLDYVLRFVEVHEGNAGAEWDRIGEFEIIP